MEKNQKKKLITHNGPFHADDVFAAAALSLFLDKKGESFEIIRTRDPEIIKQGDYVFDVGGEYDPENDRFDHHQKGGAGSRLYEEGNVEYASFGLVWKKFGREIGGSEEARKIIDTRIVAPVDAFDNGFDLVNNLYDVSPYLIQHFFNAMRPTWREEEVSVDEMFLKSVEIARIVLEREIIQANDSILAEEKVISAYHSAEDKRIVMLDASYPYDNVLNRFQEPLYVIYPKEGVWKIKAVKNDVKTFNNRKDFPEEWAGLKEDELQKITGITDAVFCHNGRFLAVARTKEGAIELAKLAVGNH